MQGNAVNGNQNSSVLMDKPGSIPTHSELPGRTGVVPSVADALGALPIAPLWALTFLSQLGSFLLRVPTTHDSLWVQEYCHPVLGTGYQGQEQPLTNHKWALVRNSAVSSFVRCRVCSTHLPRCPVG